MKEKDMAYFRELKSFVANLAGTNSCVDNERLVLLFLKYRQVAKNIQEKYHSKYEDEEIKWNF